MRLIVAACSKILVLHTKPRQRRQQQQQQQEEEEENIPYHTRSSCSQGVGSD